MKLSCNEGETLVCVCGVIIAKSSLGCNTMSDVGFNGNTIVFGTTGQDSNLASSRGHEAWPPHAISIPQNMSNIHN